MELSYGELEDFLAKIHCVAPDRRTALKGRLKHFQRLGWPPGTNKGKGARVRYDTGQILSLAVAMEMLELGMTPERVVEQLGLHGSDLALGFIDVMASEHPLEEAVFFIFDPDALRSLRDQKDGEGRTGLKHLICSQSDLEEALTTTDLRGWRRLALISMTAILRDYLGVAHDKVTGESFADVGVEISQWLVGENVSREKLRRLFKSAFKHGKVPKDGLNP